MTDLQNAVVVLTGASSDRALDRAEPAPVTQGTLRAPLDDRRRTSGGWRNRHGVPSARRLRTGLALGLGVGALLLSASAAAKSR